MPSIKSSPIQLDAKSSISRVQQLKTTVHGNIFYSQKGTLKLQAPNAMNLYMRARKHLVYKLGKTKAYIIEEGSKDGQSSYNSVLHHLCQLLK